MALKIKKLLRLFCVSKKESKKKGKSINPLWIGKSINPLWTASTPHSSLGVTANTSHLDPCLSGTGAVLSIQKPKPECSSMISSFARIEHGIGSDDYMLCNQFDVVQDFCDHHYAKTSPGKDEEA